MPHAESKRSRCGKSEFTSVLANGAAAVACFRIPKQATNAVRLDGR